MGSMGIRARTFDWDPIRGSHQGQRSCGPHQQAGHMTCTRPQAARQIPLAMRAPFSNRSLGCKHNFHADHFFCSTAPQAFFRPDRNRTGRRAQTLSRLAAFRRPPPGLVLIAASTAAHLRMSGCRVVRASSVLLPRVMVLYAVGKYRRNIRSEAQALQCPQRAHA